MQKVKITNIDGEVFAEITGKIEVFLGEDISQDDVSVEDVINGLDNMDLSQIGEEFLNHLTDDCVVMEDE